MGIFWLFKVEVVACLCFVYRWHHLEMAFCMSHVDMNSNFFCTLFIYLFFLFLHNYGNI